MMIQMRGMRKFGHIQVILRVKIEKTIKGKYRLEIKL